MLKFYHAPFSRAFGVFWLLEELGADYELVPVNIRPENGTSEDYRRIQPSKKVPAIEHDGNIVTERGAITIYLSWAFPEADLMPRAEERANFLVWNVYCDSVFDPVLCARAHGLVYANNDYPFGLFDDMVANVERHLTQNRYAAGDRFTAADTQLGSAIAYTMNVLKLLPERDVFRDYVARIEERPAYQRVSQRDYEMAMALPFFQRQFGQDGQASA